jgi:hypothetical protein
MITVFTFTILVVVVDGTHNLPEDIASVVIFSAVCFLIISLPALAILKILQNKRGKAIKSFFCFLIYSVVLFVMFSGVVPAWNIAVLLVAGCLSSVLYSQKK